MMHGQFMLCFVVALSCILLSFGSSMPLPWTRELKLQTPYQTGSDVTITQNLLIRDASVPSSSLACDGVYSQASVDAVKAFQGANALPVTGTLDQASASLLLQLHSGDGVKDSGFTAKSMGYKYKLNIPVHSNRSIETVGTLFDADNKVLLLKINMLCYVMLC